jgi:hypothetical protein
MLLLYILAATLAPPPAHTQEPARLPPDSVTRRVVLAAEAALERALVAKDRAALDTLYADDFEWRHWDGTRDTRDTWLDFLADSVSYREHTARPEGIEIYTHAAWVSGLLTSRGRYAGEAQDFGYTLRYARLWVEDRGRWRVREQLSRVLDDAGPASAGAANCSSASSSASSASGSASPASARKCDRSFQPRSGSPASLRYASSARASRRGRVHPSARRAAGARSRAARDRRAGPLR